MYTYSYDEETGGILLNTTPTVFSKEPRPVYADELNLLGFDKYWNYVNQSDTPYMWAESAQYIYRGSNCLSICIGRNNNTERSLLCDSGKCKKSSDRESTDNISWREYSKRKCHCLDKGS